MLKNYCFQTFSDRLISIQFMTGFCVYWRCIRFKICVTFTDKVREANGCVLIHCLAGISRSPTVAIAYVMRVFGMTSDEAYRSVVCGVTLN